VCQASGCLRGAGGGGARVAGSPEPAAHAKFGHPERAAPRRERACGSCCCSCTARSKLHAQGLSFAPAPWGPACGWFGRGGNACERARRRPGWLAGLPACPACVPTWWQRNDDVHSPLAAEGSPRDPVDGLQGGGGGRVTRQHAASGGRAREARAECARRAGACCRFGGEVRGRGDDGSTEDASPRVRLLCGAGGGAGWACTQRPRLEGGWSVPLPAAPVICPHNPSLRDKPDEASF
jgi:hypothetical protein